MDILIKIKNKALSWIESSARNLRNKIYRIRLKNKDFTIISSNCNGGVMAHDLGVVFNTPFINIGFHAEDYIKLLKNLEYYIYHCELVFVQPEIDGNFILSEDTRCLMAKLGDLTLYFPHDRIPETAKNNWERRKKRINWNNLYVVFTDRDFCTYEIIREFDNLPYKNKVIFTCKPYPEFKSSFYLKGFEKDGMVGICTDYRDHFGTRYLDSFDYVGWLNGKKH